MIIEWNTHIFSPDLQRYPFHQDAAYRPDVSNNPTDPLGAYLERMEEEGIDRAVLVHPEPYGDDHRLILECLEREPQLLKGTCLFYPKDSDAPRKMEELIAQQPRIIAARIHAHRGKEMYLDSFASPEVRALWEKALDLGLIIELHIGPNYARQVAEMLRAYPESTVLIDHLAEPHLGNAVEYADVLSLADFENVYMKLSGLNHFATDEPLYLSVRPFTRKVIEAFSPDRMVWGSGTPKIVDAHMEGYTETDKMKVKGDNLANLLKFV
ncbi:amidohydrolase family protein [bacterium]|nr:amidohydrolase family protein [bacterium]